VLAAPLRSLAGFCRALILRGATARSNLAAIALPVCKLYTNLKPFLKLLALIRTPATVKSFIPQVKAFFFASSRSLQRTLGNWPFVAGGPRYHYEASMSLTLPGNNPHRAIGVVSAQALIGIRS
jgi:hypothetical protein